MHRLRLAVLAAAALAAAAVPARAQGSAREMATDAAAPSAAVADLRADLAALLRGPGERGVLVVSLDRGDTLFALRPDAPMAPASTLKLYSTAAALTYLGPEFRWSTYLSTPGRVAGGVVEGDLVLYGTGDPTLDGWRLPGTEGAVEALADSLAGAGIRRVRGDVVAAGGFFDAQERADGWTAGDLRRWYGAPVASLIVGENVSAPGGRPIADPARTAAARLRAALARRGVRVDGRVRADRAGDPAFHLGEAPLAAAGRVLAAHRSPPLAEVVRVTNHVSHNLYADALLKTVGRVARGEGSWRAGAGALREMLERAGVPTGALRVEDGSGLSRLDRTTARATVALLARMAAGPLAEPFAASLPQAAHPDGLERRMRGTPAARNLRAKTGTLAGVSALAGYVTAANGERLAFCIVTNGTDDVSRVKREEDAVGARLARFRR